MPEPAAGPAIAAIAALFLVGTLTSWPVWAGERSHGAGHGRPLGAARTSKCSPVEVRTVHGGKLLPNTRLARIENGHVPCMHVEDATIASCVFAAARHAGSHRWLESPDGGFAQIGQSLSLDGKPGGDYVIAARVDAQDKVPCAEPTGMDTAGRIAEGVDLAISCVVEDMGQDYNALFAYGWYPLMNYSTMEVCAGNDPAAHPHPDGLDPVRSYATPGSAVDNVFCYRGHGASLNDINGTERDETTAYYSGEGYCHLVISSGFEAPGAKRPATRSLPAPGLVVVKSLITWKPVNPNFNIAN